MLPERQIDELRGPEQVGTQREARRAHRRLEPRQRRLRALRHDLGVRAELRRHHDDQPRSPSTAAFTEPAARAPRRRAPTSASRSTDAVRAHGRRSAPSAAGVSGLPLGPHGDALVGRRRSRPRRARRWPGGRPRAPPRCRPVAGAVARDRAGSAAAGPRRRTPRPWRRRASRAAADASTQSTKVRRSISDRVSRCEAHDQHRAGRRRERRQHRRAAPSPGSRPAASPSRSATRWRAR